MSLVSIVLHVLFVSQFVAFAVLSTGNHQIAGLNRKWKHILEDWKTGNFDMRAILIRAMITCSVHLMDCFVRIFSLAEFSA